MFFPDVFLKQIMSPTAMFSMLSLLTKISVFTFISGSMLFDTTSITDFVDNVIIRFNDGTKVKTTYTHFKDGRVRNPNTIIVVMSNNINGINLAFLCPTSVIDSILQLPIFA